MRTRALLVGLVLFLVLLVIRAPASILTGLIPDESKVFLLDPAGTIWYGDAMLKVADLPGSRLSWQFAPAALLTASLAFDLSLTGTDIDLVGGVAVRPFRLEGTGHGAVGAPFLNSWLGQYDVELSGEFVLTGIEFQANREGLVDLAGEITWPGGPVTYKLSGNLHRSTLPPLRAELGPGVQATAYPHNAQVPLLNITLSANGFVRVGVTRALTRLLGTPWPGSDPDHAEVLVVEEQVF